MFRTRLIAAAAFALLTVLPALGDTATLEIDPLAQKDLTSFRIEGEGEWKIDNVSDLIYTLVVCPKASEETSLLFIGKTFKQGFQVRFEAMGGFRNKGLDLLVVPTKGDRVVVPFSHRYLSKKDWHEMVLTVEDGSAKMEVDGEAGDPVDVPKGQPLTFAFRLEKRAEASFRKIKVRYLVVNEEQAKPDEGFVRIFDGKTMDGWKTAPDGVAGFKLGDESIVGAIPDGQDQVVLVFDDVGFADYEMKFRASGDSRNLTLIGRLGVQGQYPATYVQITNYFPGDRDWNDVLWQVKGKHVALTVNGKQVWQAEAQNAQAVKPAFVLTQGGKTRIRDIQVKGVPVGVGPSWARYAKESGVDAGGVGFGGRAGPAEGGAKAPEGTQPLEKKVLFDGSNLENWRSSPASVWSVADGKMLGLTLDKEVTGDIRYGKLVFFEYHLTFQVQKGTAGAVFVAKEVPPQVAKRDRADVAIDAAWLTKEWNDFDVWCRDGLIKVKVNGKQVYTGKVPTEQGYIGFHIAKNSAIGVKEIVFTRPE